MAIVLSLGGAAIFLLGHPWFDVTRVHVRGVEYIDHATLEQTVSEYMNARALLLFARSNRFLFSGPELAQQIGESFALASIDVGLREETLFITLEERTSNLFWKTSGRLYVVDLDGVVVREVGEDERNARTDLPLFVDRNNVVVQTGSTVLASEEIDHAFVFLELLGGAGIFTTHVEIDRLAGKWVKVVTDTDYDILIDLSGDMDAQYRRLTAVLNDQVADPSSLEYIDLRFGDRVYFK